MLCDAFQVPRAVEAGLLKVIEQTLDGGDCRVDCRRFMIATNCEEEQTDELEAVVQSGVEAVLLVALIGADAVEGFDLVDQVVVEQQDILRLHVCAAILLEQAERLAEIEDALEDRLFLRVEREAIEG